MHRAHTTDKYILHLKQIENKKKYWKKKRLYSLAAETCTHVIYTN